MFWETYYVFWESERCDCISWEYPTASQFILNKVTLIKSSQSQSLDESIGEIGDQHRQIENRSSGVNITKLLSYLSRFS